MLNEEDNENGFKTNRSKYIDLARAKSEALVYNTCKQKKLNRVKLQPRKRLGTRLVMLNGKDNENGIKINRSN